jgi:hypothetical protein
LWSALFTFQKEAMADSLQRPVVAFTETAAPVELVALAAVGGMFEPVE